MMINKKIEPYLLQVQKPGRYVGGEINSVYKNLEDVDVRFAFCFPDTYEIGMSHLGMKILYSQFNEVAYIWCERVFAPWIDMEKIMLDNNIPLWGLESGDPITDFEFIGFTLQYELSYTNILQMLKLANIPIRAKDRKGLKQIVCAGGPCACNAEPLADFFDLFFIGEGEDVDLEVIELFRKCRDEGKSREEFLFLCSQIEGVYVPSLYTAEYNDDGTLRAFTPNEGVPAIIHKRIIMDLDKVYYPDKFVVPLIEIVHDRVVEEIFRGCIRGCRFCQAGFLNRPVREKSPDTIDKQCHALCRSTGYDEISLSSLSSSDYTQIRELLDRLTQWSVDENVSLSLPSMRVDGFDEKILSKLKTVRKSGLTFAPEAGTQRMRDVINKNVTEEELVNTCTVAFKGGWTAVKLYFMLGLPTETLEDVLGIGDLAQTVVNTYYKNENRQKGKQVKVTISTAAFIPKPFTPFQWEPQTDVDTTTEKQKALKSHITSRKIVYNYHDAKVSYLEGVFARGDRRLCNVLEEAVNRGLHFDGWEACFDFDKWIEVIKDCGLDPDFYVTRRRSFDELLPWDHIDYGVSKRFLLSECQKAYANTTTPNCREKCSGCGAAKYGGGVCFEKHKSMV